MFVDLTIDDDDEDSNTPIINSRAGVFLPTSNHRLPMSNGLPLCDGLPSIESGTIGGLGQNYVENMSLARSRAMTQLARSSSRQSSRKSEDAPSTSTSRRSTPVVELPARRRRAEVLNVNSSSSSPILPNGGVKRQKIAHHGHLPGTQSALMRQLHHARVEPSTSTSIITGANRAGTDDDDAATASAVKREEILRRQVIPHCKEAVLLYQNELPKDPRRELGTRVRYSQSRNSYIADIL